MASVQPVRLRGATRRVLCPLHDHDLRQCVAQKVGALQHGTVDTAHSDFLRATHACCCHVGNSACSSQWKAPFTSSKLRSNMEVRSMRHSSYMLDELEEAAEPPETKVMLRRFLRKARARPSKLKFCMISWLPTRAAYGHTRSVPVLDACAAAFGCPRRVGLWPRPCAKFSAEGA